MLYDFGAKFGFVSVTSNGYGTITMGKEQSQAYVLTVFEQAESRGPCSPLYMDNLPTHYAKLEQSMLSFKFTAM